MKYAITCVRFDHLKQAGELLRIQAEVMTDDQRALSARIFNGDLVLRGCGCKLVFRCGLLPRCV
jgi:hypothetical protein